MADQAPRRINRRGFLKMAGIMGLTLAGLEAVGCAPGVAPSTPTPASGVATPVAAAKAETAEEALAKLVEAAKKEGKLSLYDSVIMEDLEKSVKGFKDKYPFIELELYRADGDQLVEKVLTESKAGRNLTDTARAPADNIFQLVDQGVNMKYKSPSFEGLPKGAYDPEGGWYFADHALHVIAYNTKAVPVDQAPKSIEDLGDPRFKGKLGIEQGDAEWFSEMKDIMGEAKFLDLARRIASNNPRPIKGFGELGGMVASGEIPVAVSIRQQRAVLDKSKKAPVEWAYGSTPPTSSAAMLIILKNAPHPNAAKLYVDWVLSNEGQQVDVVEGRRRFPVRPGVKVPDYAMGVQVFNPSLESLRQRAKALPEFRQIFNIR